jgi:hypothetical protein
MIYSDRQPGCNSNGLSRRIAAFVACGIVALFAASPAHSATITWTNTSGGFWSTANNWSPHFVPGGGDTAVITAAGTYTVTVDTTVSVSAINLGGTGQQTLTNNSQMITIGSATVNANGVLALGGGTLTGGPMTVQGTYNFAGGYSQLPVTILNGAVMNILNAAVNLAGPLTNAGTVNLTNGATLYVLNNKGIYNGIVQNQPTGLFNIQGNLNIYCGCYGFEYFQNNGTLRKTSGALSASIGVAFTNSNSATIDAQSGTIAFNSAGNIAGNYNAASNAIVEFDSGNYTETGPVTVTGVGICRQNGATVTLLDRITRFVLFSGNVALAPNFETNGMIQSLQLDGAYLIGTNTVSGTLGINSGGIGSTSPLTVNPGGTLNFNGGGPNIDSPLTNFGTIAWSGTTIFVNNNNGIYTGAVYNQPGALFNAQGDQSLFSGGYGFEFFKNAGTVRKSAGTGVTSFGIAFTNSGTIDAQTGFIRFTSGNGNLAGTYNTAPGAFIEFTGGNFIENGAVTITGSGVCRENGANITLIDQIPKFPLISGSISLAPNFETNGTIQSLQLDGVALLSTNVVVGTLGINGGTIAAPLTVSNGAALNFNGAAVSIDGPVTNFGTINWTGTGSLFVNNNNTSLTGLIYNRTGALFNAACDLTVVSGQDGFEQFRNEGIVRKSAGFVATTFQLPFTNSGTIDAESGRISFSMGGNLAGTYNTAGTIIEFAGGNFTENGAVSITGNGICRLNGANVTLSNQIANFQLISGNVALTPNFETDGTIHSLQLDGAQLVGTNIVTGTLGMNGGGVQAQTALTIAPAGTLNLNGGGITVAGPLTNNGTINWSSPSCSIYVNNNASSVTGGIFNNPGGLINVLNDQNLSTAQSGFELIRNDGTIRKTISVGATTINVPFVQNGLLDVQSGIISFTGPYSSTGGTMNFGITSLAYFGHINFSANAPLTGNVSANLNGVYFPSIGDTFKVLTYGSFSGSFAGAALPLPGQWQTNYTTTFFTITVTNVTAVVQPVDLMPVSYVGGSFTLQITGPVGPAYVIEASTNLLTWISLVTNTPSVVPFNYTDTNAGSSFSRRFYRIGLQ